MNNQIFVLQFMGDVHSKADRVTLHVFASNDAADTFIAANSYVKVGKFSVFTKVHSGFTVDIPDVTVDQDGKITVY